jgi:pimeloyl-ACP methyl ester carboxylesterase
MLLYNPGGPGGSGILALHDGARGFANTTVGKNWDLVSCKLFSLSKFKSNYLIGEPRGVGIFPLSANGCSNITSNKKRATPLLGDDRYDRLYSSVIEKGTACEESIGGADQIGPNMHTTAVVNDMISIVDAYTLTTPDSKEAPNSTLVNFWGESYGTVIGQYFASIYPQRVGRFFIDGVVDPDDWAAAFAFRSSQTTDEAFASFFMFCSLAGPLKVSNGSGDAVGCPYYTGTTPIDVWNRFYALISQLDPQIASSNNWNNASAIEFGLTSLKITAVNFLYDYVRFPNLANYLLAMEQIVAAQNITVDVISNLLTTFGAEKPPGFSRRGRVTIQDSGDDSLTAVTCTDVYPASRYATNEQVIPYARLLESMSWIYSGEDAYQCVGWLIDPIGPFFSGWLLKSMFEFVKCLISLGPFGGNTQNPILFGTSTRDPVTPPTK